MNLNFNALIVQLTPTFIRRTGFLALLGCLITPLKQLYLVFESWKTEAIAQAHITSQVVSLQAWINYKMLGSLLPVIEIRDDPSGLFDFIIDIPSGIIIDSDRLYSLVNKFKTTGKSFTIGDVNIVYQGRYEGAVCEQMLPAYGGEYGHYVCEQNEESYQIRYSGYLCEEVLIRTDNRLRATVESVDSQYYVVLTADTFVASALEVEVWVDYDAVGLALTMNLLSGEYECRERIDIFVSTDEPTARVRSITPDRDETFNYIF